MSAEVFISYASNDKERVLEIVDRLRDAGVSVWIDQGGIEGATMWSQEIVEAIDDCKVMLLAISSSSTESKNVIKELALASERQKSILPICLEDSGIPKSMEYQLAGIQRVEYLANAEDAGHAAALRALAKLGVSVNANALGAAGQPAARQSHGSSKAENGNGMKIAAAVVRSIRRNRPELVLGPDAQLSRWAQWLSPGTLRWGLSRAFRLNQRQIERDTP